MSYEIISDIVERVFGEECHPLIKAYEKYFLMMLFPPEIKLNMDKSMPIGKIFFLDLK